MNFNVIDEKSINMVLDLSANLWNTTTYEILV